MECHVANVHSMRFLKLNSGTKYYIALERNAIKKNESVEQINTTV